MDTEELAREFADLYRQIYDRFHRRDSLSDYRMTPESHAVLKHLDRTGPLTVMEASRHFGRSQSAVSELVDRLCARELVERIKDERDRRRTLVWLTPLGLKVLDEFDRVLSVELLEKAMGQLDGGAMSDALIGFRRLLETKKAPPPRKEPNDE